MAASSTSFVQQQMRRPLPLIAGLLAVALVFVLLLFVLQWYLINAFFHFAAELVKGELLQQAPEGVEVSEITKTFERVERVRLADSRNGAVTSMPVSYITGRIDLKVAKAAADYALKANEDGTWTSEEINTLLQMMNAAVGFKREEK